MFTVTELASALGAAGMRMAGANVVKRNAVKKVKYLLQFPLVFQTTIKVCTVHAFRVQQIQKAQEIRQM